MKLTFVTTRAGADIVGGAEHAAAMLAQNCIKYGGVEAEILTTTSGDERTWSAKYSAGEDIVAGIKVQRFGNEPINRARFDAWAQQLLENPSNVTSAQFDEWLTKQGPYSPDLLSAIEDCTSDAIIFHPMLSSPTSHGVFRARRPVVIHPALHDEPLSRMPGYREVISRADLIAFSTRCEQQLSSDLLGTGLRRQSVIGFGVDAPMSIDTSVSEDILRSYGLESSEYAIVIGRVDSAKGADLCFHLFNEFASHIHGIKKLVFVGPVSETSSVHASAGVVVTGSINDETKWALLKGARCLINPSTTESFSLVVLEAMKVGVPVVVNGHCGPTSEHVKRSSSGAMFTNTAEFISAVGICSEDSVQRNEMIRRARQYVDDFYDWESLSKRYIETLEVACSAVTSS